MSVLPLLIGGQASRAPGLLQVGPSTDSGPDNINKITVLQNNNADPIDFNIIDGSFQPGESIEIVRGDLGEVNIGLFAGAVFFPPPPVATAPDHTIANVGQSAVVTCLGELGGQHIFLIRGGLNT